MSPVGVNQRGELALHHHFSGGCCEGTYFQVDVVKEPSREIPVMRKVDVVVVGGGPGGFGAAIAAARNGAETLLHRTLWFLRWYANGRLSPLATGLIDSCRWRPMGRRELYREEL